MKENKALPIINVQADTKFERKDKAKQVLEYVQSLKSDDSGWSDMKEAEYEEYKNRESLSTVNRSIRRSSVVKKK